MTNDDHFVAITWMDPRQEKPKYSEEICPSAVLSITDPTWFDQTSNSGRRGGKPASNRLNYGTALDKMLVGSGV
jgi:hypothetical protein